MAIENGSTSGLSSVPASTSTSNGNTILPVARVRRIIKEEDVTCGADVSFLITATAERFIEYLVKQGLEQAKNEGRKNLGYQDLADAVTKTNSLGFLKEVIPQTCTFEDALKLYDEAMKTRSELQSTMLSDNDESDSDGEEDYNENNCEENVGDHSEDDTSESSIIEDKPNGRSLHLNGHNNRGAENGISSDSELSEAPETSPSENSSDTVVNDL